LTAPAARSQGDRESPPPRRKNWVAVAELCDATARRRRPWRRKAPPQPPESPGMHGHREAGVRVEVRLFAVARQRVGRPTIVLEVPEPATVAVLKRALAEACPALAPLVPNLLIAVDSEYAAADATIPLG